MHILCGRQPKAPLGALVRQQPCGQLVGHLDVAAKVACCVLRGIAQKQGQSLGAPRVQARFVPLQPLSLGWSQTGQGAKEVSTGGQSWNSGIKGPQERGEVPLHVEAPGGRASSFRSPSPREGREELAMKRLTYKALQL